MKSSIFIHTLQKVFFDIQIFLLNESINYFDLIDFKILPKFYLH